MTKPNEMVLNDKALEAAARGIFDTWAAANNCDMSWEEAVTASCDVKQYPKMSAIVPLCRAEAKAAIIAYLSTLLADMPERAELVTLLKTQTILATSMGNRTDNPRNIYNLADQAAALLSLPDQGGEVTVKPLEWVLKVGGVYNEGPTSIGTYAVMNRDGHWSWEWVPDGVWNHSDKGKALFEQSGSEQQAMAAAQTDYETRIRAALTNGGEGNDLV